MQWRIPRFIFSFFQNFFSNARQNCKVHTVHLQVSFDPVRDYFLSLSVQNSDCVMPARTRSDYDWINLVHALQHQLVSLNEQLSHPTNEELRSVILRRSLVRRMIRMLHTFQTLIRETEPEPPAQA